MKLKHAKDEHKEVDLEGGDGGGGGVDELHRARTQGSSGGRACKGGLRGEVFFFDELNHIRPNVDVNADRRLQICDRRSSSRVGLQRGFTAFIAPLHCGIAALLPRLAPLAARLAATHAAWEARGADEDAALEAEAAALPWGSVQSPSR